MKKIFSLVALAVTTVLAFTACSDDNDSNPTVVTPGSFTVNTPEFANTTVDLNQTENIRLTWDAPVFTDLQAPLAAFGESGLLYEIQVSKSGKFTKSLADAEAENADDPTGYDYVSLDTPAKTTDSDVACADINKALNQLKKGEGEAWEKGTDIPALTASIRVKAKVCDASGREAASVLSNIFTIGVKPFWVDVKKKSGAAYLWIPGGACAGGWGFGDLCPIISSEANDGIYSGYAYLTKDGEFKFTKQAAWADEYNNSNFESCSTATIDLGDKAGGNIKYIGESSMCYILVDVNEGETSLTVTPVKWGVVGAFNGWSVDDGKIIDMTYNASEGCLEADAAVTADGWKFARDNSWTINFGGSLDALEQDGADLKIAGSKVKLFIENAQKGPHATVE